MDDIFDFSGKVVFVTGGAGTGGGASGRFISEYFAACHAKVAVADSEYTEAKRVAASIWEVGGDAVGINCDVCDIDSVRSALAVADEVYGGIDIVVNNAFWHATEQPRVGDYAVSEWDKHVDINLRSPFLVTKYALPYLLKNERSAIVNIGSTGARRGEDGYCAYSAAKAGLESFTRTVATEYGREGLRCNCLVPGLVLSDDMDTWVAGNAAMKGVFGRIDRNMLLEEGHGSGRDVAYGVLFLASEGARYITGQSLVMDGGTTIHFPQWADMRDLYS